MSKIDFHAYGLKPLHTFDQIVIGPNNQFAASACQAVAKAPGETYNPLFLYGPPGVGKTHLAQAVAHYLLQENPQARIKYVSAERFMSDIIAAISDDNVMPVRDHYSELDLLVLDDVQFLTESKSAQEEFLHIINMMNQASHQVILAADRPPNQLVALNTTLRSRLEGGLSTDIKLPDTATRLEILKRKQATQGITLPEEMLLYVAERLVSNVRELEGFLKRIHAYMTLSRQEINLELVKSVVKEIAPNGYEPLAPAAQGTAAAPPVAPSAPIVVLTNGDTPPIAKNGTGRKEKAPAESIPMLEREDVWATPQAKVKAPELVTATPKRAAKEPPPEAPAVRHSPPPPPPVETHLPDPLEEVAEEENVSGHKEVSAVFFYPKGCTQALDSVHGKFQEVIKKHKLKFRLKKVNSYPYECKGKISYATFVDACKESHVPVAIVIGPPPEAYLPEQDFYDLLSVTLDVQGISLQLVNWGEIHKDYRYLNLALDIALVKSR